MSKTLQLKILIALQDKISAPLKSIRGGVGASSQSIKDLRDKLKGLEATQQDVGRFGELFKGLTQTRSELHQAQSRVQQLAKALDTVAQPTRTMQQEFRRAIADAQRLKQTHGQQSIELQTLRSRLSTAGLSTRNLVVGERELRTSITQTNHALTEQKNRLAQVTQRQKRLAETKRRLDHGMRRNAGIAEAGHTTRSAGMSIGRGMKNFLHVGYDFNAQMSKTQAVTRIADKSDPRMQALREQARTLPLNSKFTDLEVAQGQYDLARTGYTPEQILKAMPGMLNLAAAGDMELGVAADIASNIQTAMAIPVEEMGRVADVLTGASTRHNVDISMLGESLKYSAVVGKEFGQSLETVVSATALLGRAGIEGSMVDTAMRSVLSPLGNSKALAELGVKSVDKQGNMRELPDIMEDIAEATKDMGNVERGAVFEKIAGKYAMPAFGTLMEATKTGDFRTMVNSVGEGSIGDSGRVAGTMLDNLQGDLTFMQAALDNISIELFEQNEDWMRSLVRTATDYLLMIGEFLKAHPAVSKGIVMFGAALSALMVVFGTLTIGVVGILKPLVLMQFLLAQVGIRAAGMGGLLSTLAGVGKRLGGGLLWIGRSVLFIGRALALTPIGLLVTGIAVAAFLVYKYWQPIRGFFLGLWGQVRTAFSQGVGGVIALLVNWSPFGWIYKAWVGVLRYLGIEVPGSLSEAGMAMLRGLGDGANRAWLSVQALFGQFWAELKGGAAGGLLGIGAVILNWSPLGLFYQVMAGVMSYFGIELPAKFTGFGSMIFSGLINGITGMAGAVKDSIMGLGDQVVGWFREKLDIHSPSRVFMGFGQNISEGAAIGVTQRKPTVGKAVQGLVATVLSAGVVMAAGANPLQAQAYKYIPKAIEAVEQAKPLEKLKALRERSRAATVRKPRVRREPIPMLVEDSAAIRWQEKLPVLQPPVAPAVSDVVTRPNSLLSQLRERLSRFLAPAGEVLSSVGQTVEQALQRVGALVFDTRPSIQHPVQQNTYRQESTNSQYSQGSDHIEINIYPQAGQSSTDIAQAVRLELERYKNEQRARQRSSLNDY